MKSIIQKFLLKYLPELYYAIASWRFFNRCKKKFQDFQHAFFVKVYDTRSLTVLSGPFIGLAYFNKIVWGPITPKWIGSYEEELHEVTNTIIARRYAKIIDVGAAEGYYAVGLAYKCPKSNVVSYDIDPIARHRQKQLAALNNLQNLEIRKFCSHDELRLQIIENCFILSDIEGFELELIDPVKCPQLKTCDILIEVHQSNGLEIHEVESAIANRFTGTHSISRFGVTTRIPEHYQNTVTELKCISLVEIDAALDEHRDARQRWLWLEAIKA